MDKQFYQAIGDIIDVAMSHYNPHVGPASTILESIATILTTHANMRKAMEPMMAYWEEWRTVDIDNWSFAGKPRTDLAVLVDQLIANAKKALNDQS